MWAWLVRPDRWDVFYANAWRVLPLDGPWPVLGLGSRFRWITFGAPVTTEITEFEAPHRLGWTGTGLGAVGHHAWLIEPTGAGCRIVTEQWVDAAARIAESGLEPGAPPVACRLAFHSGRPGLNGLRRGGCARNVPIWDAT